MAHDGEGFQTGIIGRCISAETRRKKTMSKNIDRQEQSYSRRAFLSTALATPALAADFSSSLQQASLSALFDAPSGAFPLDRIQITSPDGKIRFELLWRDQSRLSYQVTFKSKPVIETSLMGIIIDNVDFSQGVEIGKSDTYQMKEKYPWRGVHSETVNHCNGVKISVRHPKSNTSYTVEVRAFNDGVAFRYVVPGNGQRVPDEATAFVLPVGSAVWFHDFEGHYEGVHARKNISEVKDGEWAAPPLTIKLPNSAGYASLTEGALINYSGLGFQADGQRGFKARLGHAHPVSYPFRLRYAGDVERVSHRQPLRARSPLRGELV